MLLLFKLRQLYDLLFENDLFIHFIVRVWRGHLSIYGWSSFPFGFEAGNWAFIIFVPDHCISYYFLFRTYS